MLMTLMFCMNVVMATFTTMDLPKPTALMKMNGVLVIQHLLVYVGQVEYMDHHCLLIFHALVHFSFAFH